MNVPAQLNLEVAHRHAGDRGKPCRGRNKDGGSSGGCGCKPNSHDRFDSMQPKGHEASILIPFHSERRIHDLSFANHIFLISQL